MERKRLVIFGCGYIGIAIAREALSRGFIVEGMTRNGAAVEELRKLGINAIEAQLHERDWHSRIDPRPDIVVNCVSSAGNGLEGYQQSYIQGQKSILEWLGSYSPEVYIYTSSTSVYPQSNGETVDEASPIEDPSPAGKLLLQSEELLLGSGVSRPFVLRLAGIYGPGRHHLVDQVKQQTEIPGTGDFHLNLVQRDDIVSAVFGCIGAASNGGVYNICDNEPHLKKEVADWIAAELNLPPPVFNPNKSSARQLRRSASSGIPDRKVLNLKAKTELGWSPRYSSFKEGYKQILAAT